MERIVKLKESKLKNFKSFMDKEAQYLKITIPSKSIYKNQCNSNQNYNRIFVDLDKLILKYLRSAKAKNRHCWQRKIR